jgi:hypothetical protein
MGLLDLALAPIRAVLGGAEDEVEHMLPVRDIEHIQARVLETAEAIKGATESIESHVAVIETLATSVQPLTLAVEQLTVQLVELTKLLAPVAAAEREVSRVGHLFSRHHDLPASPETPQD